MRVSNQSVPKTIVLSTRPMKPRQSGRTISIRNAKQYKSFHMPTQSTSKTEAGCCCDAALSRTHYRSACCQVNHHELMQRHQCHIRCECTGTMHTQCTSVWQELIGLPIARCSHRRGAAPNTHSGVGKHTIAVLSAVPAPIDKQVRGTCTKVLHIQYLILYRLLNTRRHIIRTLIIEWG